MFILDFGSGNTGKNRIEYMHERELKNCGGEIMEIKTKHHIIGENRPCYIIAEMSANHEQDFEKAKDIIYASKESGADCIKLQTYTPDTLTINSNADYFKIKGGIWNGQIYYDLYKLAYMPWEWQVQLKELAESIGIDFLSTAYDESSVDFLESLNVDMYKIASFEICHIPLLNKIIETKKPVILSTGMATGKEISIAEFLFAIKEIPHCLLHCLSNYPAKAEDMNLNNISILKENYKCLIGFSDHSLGYLSSCMAVTLGAKVIEKHFKISECKKSPDASFSMGPKQFKNMVQIIRNEIEPALKEKEERADINSRRFRPSIYVIKDLKKGDILTKDNLKICRPNMGISPEYYNYILGKTVNQDISKNSPLYKEEIYEI